MIKLPANLIIGGCQIHDNSILLTLLGVHDTAMRLQVVKKTSCSPQISISPIYSCT